MPRHALALSLFAVFVLALAVPVAEGDLFGRLRWGPPDRIAYVMAAGAGKVWVRDVNEAEDVCLEVSGTRRNRLENLRFGSRYGLHMRKGRIVNFDRKRGRLAQQGPHDRNPCLAQHMALPQVAALGSFSWEAFWPILLRGVQCMIEPQAAMSRRCTVSDGELREICRGLVEDVDPASFIDTARIGRSLKCHLLDL